MLESMSGQLLIPNTFLSGKSSLKTTPIFIIRVQKEKTEMQSNVDQYWPYRKKVFCLGFMKSSTCTVPCNDMLYFSAHFPFKLHTLWLVSLGGSWGTANQLAPIKKLQVRIIILFCCFIFLCWYWRLPVVVIDWNQLSSSLIASFFLTSLLHKIHELSHRLHWRTLN